MVSVSEYLERSKYHVVEVVTRNPDTVRELKNKLKEGDKYWYDEQIETRTRYRFRFPKKRKKEIKKKLKELGF